VKDAETTKLSFGMAILCSVQNFGYYGVMIWLPNYLRRPDLKDFAPRPIHRANAVQSPGIGSRWH